jgi:Ni,Fe-hydrogenase III large subunit
MKPLEPVHLAPAGRIHVPPSSKHGRPARLVTLFGSTGEDGRKRIFYVFDTGQPQYVVMELDAQGPVASICGQTPAASWPERELRDEYGIELSESPDSRPLLWHDPKQEYSFVEVTGDGITTVPVGPVHAGIIEPGHFRFSVIGDLVLHLELRPGWTRKGVEKLFQGRPVMSGAMLAESVSGDNCFSHAVAYCQAVENAMQLAVPPRCAALRLVGLELERLGAHIGDVGALCNDVALVVPAARGAELKESLLQASARWTGTRYWRGLAVPGGMRANLDDAGISAFSQVVSETAHQFAELVKTVMETPSVQNRFDSAGILATNVARDLAVVGPVARASGVHLDVRRDHPYGLYGQMEVQVLTLHYGDVMARARIRIEEAAISAELIQQTLSALPLGPCSVPVAGPARTFGYSGVESPRGELFYWVEMAEGRVTRCHIKSPSFQNWPALPFAVSGAVIADFPLINKSFNLSYSGCDR